MFHVSDNSKSNNAGTVLFGILVGVMMIAGTVLAVVFGIKNKKKKRDVATEQVEMPQMY